VWVPGHVGIEENVWAGEIAKEGRGKVDEEDME